MKLQGYDLSRKVRGKCIYFKAKIVKNNYGAYVTRKDALEFAKRFAKRYLKFKYENLVVHGISEERIDECLNKFMDE